MFAEQIVMRKNSYKNLRLASLAFHGSDKKLKLFTSFVLHIPHNSFPYQKSWCVVQINVVTP